MSPREVSLPNRTSQVTSARGNRALMESASQNCPVGRDQVPQKCNCSSGFERVATRQALHAKTLQNAFHLRDQDTREAIRRWLLRRSVLWKQPKRTSRRRIEMDLRN